MSTLLDKVNASSPLATMAAAPAEPLFLGARALLPVTSTPTIAIPLTLCNIQCGDGDEPEIDMSS